MEITKCSHNCQTTFQYFNCGSSKSSQLQSGSIFGALAIKPLKGFYQVPLFQWT
jgi:hypothetical protein